MSNFELTSIPNLCLNVLAVYLDLLVSKLNTNSSFRFVTKLALCVTVNKVGLTNPRVANYHHCEA